MFKHISEVREFLGSMKKGIEDGSLDPSQINAQCTWIKQVLGTYKNQHALQKDIHRGTHVTADLEGFYDKSKQL